MHVLTILYTQGGGGTKHKGGWLLGCKGLGTLDVVPNYVVLVLGNESGGGPHMQGRHTRSLWTGLRKLVVLTLNIHQIFK